MNDYEFGNFIYMLRNEKGLTQSELGKMLGVTNKAVSKWENGSAKPNTSLIPKLAEIFEITVEELFACKRLDKNSEAEKIKAYLSKHKKRQAKLVSVYLSAICIIPLLIFEFVGIVMGFNLPDEILGPLGSVALIILFIISLSCFFTHKRGFKLSWSPSELTISESNIKALKYTAYIVTSVFYSLLILLLPIYSVFVWFSKDSIPAKIFLCIAFFILIISIGVLIFCFNYKRLLKIKFSSGNLIHFTKKEKFIIKTQLSLAILSFPWVIEALIFAFLFGKMHIIHYSILFIWFGNLISVIAYTIKRSRTRQ